MAEAEYSLPSSAVQPAPATTQPEGAYAYNPAMVAEAQAMLIEFFRKPRWLELLAIIVEQAQAVEDATWATHVSFDVDTAVGDQLDLLGKLVGERRNDRLDDAYRVAVRTRILVNGSEGSLPELLTIMETADPALDIIAQEHYPAGVLFRWLSTFTAISPRDLMNLVQQAKPAGVRVQAVIRDTVSGLRLSTTADAGNPTTRAFATVTPGGDGGLAARVI